MQYIYLHGFASRPESTKARFFRERFAEKGIPLEIPRLDGGDFENLTITGQLQVIAAASASDELVLIGSSLGGYLAALYASRHPEVKRVVLMAPAFCFPRRWEAELGAEAFENWRCSGTRTVFHYGDEREREIRFGLIEDGLQYEDYPYLKIPSLLLHGVADTVVPIEYSYEFVRRQGESAELSSYPSDHSLGDVLPELWERTQPFLFHE